MNNYVNYEKQLYSNENHKAEYSFLPESMSATMAYVPFQLDLSVFSAEESLCKGTLFHELNKPFKGRCIR